MQLTLFYNEELIVAAALHKSAEFVHFAHSPFHFPPLSWTDPDATGIQQNIGKNQIVILQTGTR